MTRPSEIARFVEAQADGEYEGALAEIRAGRKRGHWIWYTFPQIAGLGQSHMSQAYAIHDRSEAEEYLRHPLLSQRLLEIAGAAADHLRNGVALNTLMGSSIDAAKLVSSMTLFGEVARTLPAQSRTATTDSLANAAEAILAAAASQGYPRCEHTIRVLAHPPAY
jgi:uncharacterized protein (DUF1810 family)